MVNSRPPLLCQQVISKHPPCTDPVSCFAELAGFDPDDPNGEKAARAAAAAKAKKAAKNQDSDMLLDAGLGGKKKK